MLCTKLGRTHTEWRVGSTRVKCLGSSCHHAVAAQHTLCSNHVCDGTIMLPRGHRPLPVIPPSLPPQGLWPNYLKVVPSIAIAFVTYEQVKEWLGVEFRISE